MHLTPNDIAQSLLYKIIQNYNEKIPTNVVRYLASVVEQLIRCETMKQAKALLICTRDEYGTDTIMYQEMERQLGYLSPTI